MMLFLKDLQRLGKKAGFDAVGATTAEDFPELIPWLQDYGKRGRTGFEAENIVLRTKPKAWMPEAKALIAVAMSYLTEAGKRHSQAHPADPLTGRVTVYSYGQDYHKVMRERLEILLRLIEQHLGQPVTAQYAVDTSPLVDRRVAERAGIGWIGKNCSFYTARYGSYVFLGTLAVDVAVESASFQQSSRCGTCELCLKACPTNAFVASSVIDATRCLSYITQMKGMIPEEFRKPLGKRVWGCDTCQVVCPENNFVKPSEHLEYLPAGDLEFPRLLEILQWSNRDFARRYGHTAAAWRGVGTWKRNALIALGNCRRKEAVAHIVPFLNHSRPELRASAAWAMKQIGGREARGAVFAAWSREELAWVRKEMSWAQNEGEKNAEV